MAGSTIQKIRAGKSLLTLIIMVTVRNPVCPKHEVEIFPATGALSNHNFKSSLRDMSFSAQGALGVLMQPWHRECNF